MYLNKNYRHFLPLVMVKRHVLEVILGLSQKVISNYVNRIAQTPVDAMFEAYAWKK